MGCFSGAESKATSQTKLPIQRTGTETALGKVLPKLEEPPAIFEGERIVPFSQLQERATAGAGAIAEDFLAPQRAGTPLFEEATETTRSLLAGELGADPIVSGDFFERSIERPALRRLERDVIPGIDEDFSGPGFHAAARSQERSQRRQETAEFLDKAQADFDLSIQQFNTGLAEARAGRAQAAVPQALAVGQVPTQEIRNNIRIAAEQLGILDTAFGFGAREQTQAQIELEDEIARFAEENQILDPGNLAVLMGLLGLNFSTSQRSASGPGLGFQAVSSFAGSAGKAAGTNLGSQFFATPGG
jgi:hypothetical protein